MNHMDVDGVAIAYESVGDSEPVVFVHGALIANAFWPLLEASELSDAYRLIAYHRIGYGESGPASGIRSIDRQAADCIALMDSLGITRAHIAGHSFGGAIAIQLAMDAPERVHSLALLEPALFGEATGAAYRESLAAGERRFKTEPTEPLVDDFLRMRFGDGYRANLERTLPGAFDQALADAGTSFAVDLPGLREWQLDEEDIRRLSMPVLNVIGGESEALWARFGEIYRMIFDWLPQAEGVVLEGAAHGMMMQNPRGMADAFRAFWGRHPMAR